jgi:hypothetical protein
MGRSGGSTEYLGLVPVATGLVVVVLLLFAAACFAAFWYRWRQARDYRSGVRGRALVIAVNPMPAWQHRSIAAAPTDSLVLATAQFPGGVHPDQAFPRGLYTPGQVVPVVQRGSDPSRLYVDLPGQAPPFYGVYGYLSVGVLAVVALVSVLVR